MAKKFKIGTQLLHGKCSPSCSFELDAKGPGYQTYRSLKSVEMLSSSTHGKRTT